MVDLKDQPWLVVSLAILATWRVTHLLAREDGPFTVLARIRARLGSGFLGSLMDCFACLSLWVAAPLAWVVTQDPAGWLVSWLGLSGAACLIEWRSERPVVMERLPEEDRSEQDSHSHELLRTTTNGAESVHTGGPERRNPTRDGASPFDS